MEEEEALFEQLYGIENARYDFESQLAILSKFYNPRQIREALGKIYSKKYYPHLIYETVAHLLKHRFVDVVINYNFDEVLDQAIEEELRGGDYRRVISDGDCDDLSKLVVDEQLKVPLYIKPHGTISHKSTLRFTKDAYVGMPSDLLAFTKKILFGDTREDPTQQRDRFHVNLISIGFAFTSIELIEMLKGHDRLKVFHLNLEQKAAELHRNVGKIGDGVRQYLIGIQPPWPRNAPESEPLQGTGTWTSIEEATTELFGAIVKQFEYPYQPRKLGRHQFVHELLFSTAYPAAQAGVPPTSLPWGAGRRLPSQDRYYLLARLYVELTIALAKGNGRIDLGTLVGDRVGIYFRAWRGVEPGGGVSLREVCANRLGLTHQYGFTGTVFTIPREEIVREMTEPDLPTATAPEIAQREHERVLSTTLATWLWNKLYRVLEEIDDRAFREHVRELAQGDGRNRAINRLAVLVDSDAHELAPQFGLDALLLMNHNSASSVIHTSLGLTTRFMQLLDDHDWDLLLAVTEHGKILRKLEKHIDGATRPGRIRRRASVVVADAPYSRVLDSRLAHYRNTTRLLVGGDYRLPYWAHNDHMVVVLRMGVAPGSFEPLGGISFRRNGLENRINPVFVEDGEDLKMLVRIYFGYVAKADRFMNAPPDERRGVPDVDYAIAESTRCERFMEWWDEMINDSEPPSDSPSVPVMKLAIPEPEGGMSPMA